MLALRQLPLASTSSRSNPFFVQLFVATADLKLPGVAFMFAAFKANFTQPAIVVRLAALTFDLVVMKRVFKDGFALRLDFDISMRIGIQWQRLNLMISFFSRRQPDWRNLLQSVLDPNFGHKSISSSVM